MVAGNGRGVDGIDGPMIGTLGGVTLARVKEIKWMSWATSTPTWKQLVGRPWAAWTPWMASTLLPLMGKEGMMSQRHHVPQLLPPLMAVVRIFNIHRRRLEPVIPAGVAQILGRVGNLCMRHLGELPGRMLANSVKMDQCTRHRGDLRGTRQACGIPGTMHGTPGMEPTAIGPGTRGKEGMATIRVTTVTLRHGQGGVTGSRSLE